MKRTFRGKEVIGWKLVENVYKNQFEDELNSLMDKYEFVDCQFSSCAKTNLSGRHYTEYSALVLLAEKEF